jgi:hypothetical protein
MARCIADNTRSNLISSFSARPLRALQKCSLAKRTQMDFDFTFSDSVLTSRARPLGCTLGSCQRNGYPFDDPAHAAKVHAHAGFEARFPPWEIGARLDRRGERGEDLLKVGAAEQGSRAQ